MAQRTPPAARQRDPERTKGRILQAATAEFAEKGYAGARVGSIAERAGVNKQLISYYFGGKEGLYRAIGEQWLESEAAAAEDDRRSTLGEQVTRYLHTPREMTRLFVWEGLTTEEDPGEEARTARMRDGLADLRRRQLEGELAEDIDLRAFMLAFMGATLMPVAMPQLVRSIYGDDTDPSDEAFLAEYAEQVATIVGHLSAPDPD